MIEFKVSYRVIEMSPMVNPGSTEQCKRSVDFDLVDINLLTRNLFVNTTLRKR